MVAIWGKKVMNRLVLHHTGSEEGRVRRALEKQKNLECFGIERSRRAKEAVYRVENLKHKFLAADKDIKDKRLASKSAKIFECDRTQQPGGQSSR